MSKSHRLAWAAGFIDGDGWITIQNRKTKYKDKVYEGKYLRVGVGQAEQTTLLELQSLFGGNIRPKNTKGRDNFKRLPQWIWCVSTEQAAECLRQILPFMIHKKEVAILGLKFQETMSNNKRQLDDSVVQNRIDIQNKIQHLNSLS